jgi:hypothetical protein
MPRARRMWRLISGGRILRVGLEGELMVEVRGVRMGGVWEDGRRDVAFFVYMIFTVFLERGRQTDEMGWDGKTKDLFRFFLLYRSWME